MMRSRSRQSAWLHLCGVALLVSGAGCSTPKPVEAPVFFPAPPAEPRIQFLTSYARAEDFQPPKRLLAFVLGKPEQTRHIVKPYGVDLKGGKIYICDTVLGGLEILDLATETFDYFVPGGQGRLQKPINVAVDEGGTIYIADTVRGQVVIFGPDREYVGAIGNSLETKPSDVVIGPDRLYITNLEQRNVGVYDKTTRDLLFTIPRDPDDENARLYQPTNLALDGDRRLYVSDTGSFRIQVYDLEGGHVNTIGRPGDSPGEFARPKGVAVDREHRLFVVDAATQVVQVFDEDGRLLLFFGAPGESRASFVLPAGVSIDYEHVDYFRPLAEPGFSLEYLLLVTSQYGDRKVSVFGFGRNE